MGKIETVDAYIQNAAEEARPILSEIRTLFTSTLPDAEEKISYNVPFYKYYGELGGYAAYKKHVSFGLGVDGFSDEMRERLESKGYKLGKGTMQIRFDQEVPRDEIIEMLRLKARVNEEK
ncbi:hypothetical protein MFLO_00760 [Listeria floridensis FSL S10-1187]|uniref:YdhG-like domain-containing protein n=1 Tax=Listeria floridensis FSL S10-1187 TaxID=1265817 RepID=A0ABP3B1D4_9LIST|nr:DUF1801 domain-containing protein [Listeria floridensis]EUJ33730.1 hypothetical protein MFLO_00760 [Listeria floridensis FSL S10-1187]